MAKATNKKKNVEVTTESEAEKQSIVLQHIQAMSIDRTAKDIKDWKDAMENAESVYYPNRAELYDIYSRITLDGHLSGAWEKLIASILNKQLCAYDAAGKKVDEADQLIDSPMFRKFIRLILESEGWGISGAEFIPGAQFTFITIPRKHIQPHKRVILKYQSDADGINYDGVWNIMVIGDKDNLGFLLKCAPYVLWKQGNYADWAQFVEIFGHPFRLYEYDVFDVKTKQAAAEMMKATGGSQQMLKPKQLGFTVLDGKQSNTNGELYDRLKNSCNDEISVIVLGNTETTKSSSSSGYAQAKEHAAQQDEVMRDKMKLITGIINSPEFMQIVASYGFSSITKFDYEEAPDLDQLTKQLSIVKQVSQIVPVADDHFYETFHIPKPNNYDELKAKQEEEKQLRQASLSTFGGSGNDPKKTSKGGGQKPSTTAELTFLEKLRSMIADFFAPGHKD